MKTKTIFKTLAMAMMMPAMLLTTACSSDDDAIANNNETPAKKGYPLQVSVNVTRQGDNATTRATYTDNDNKTGSLSFSSGDQLFIYGADENAGQFAGTLTWVSGETFRGTITTKNSYSGTANDLFSSAGSASSDYYLIAELLPNGYETYGFYSITENDGYDDELNYNNNNTFATTKALAVEQFSREWTDEYDNGFALRPGNSILNFTISGLTASTEVNVALTGNGCNITGEVTTDGSGTATFAIGVSAGVTIKNYSLTVGGNAITLPEKNPEPGKIYNISRSVAPAARALTSATTDDIGKIAGADGNIYATKAAAEAVATGNAVAMIAYVGTASDCAHGLAIALADESGTKDYGAAGTACSGKAAVTVGTWRLPSEKDWQYMFIGCGSSESYSAPKAGMKKSYSELASKLTTAQGDALQSDYYWSSTEIASPSGSTRAWSPYFGNGNWAMRIKTSTSYVRACLAF
jgi:hypothetical protein